MRLKWNLKFIFFKDRESIFWCLNIELISFELFFLKDIGINVC